MVCTAVVVLVGFHLRHQEQSLLIEKEQLSRERADAEMRYRILADNAVDIIVHLRGSQVVWVSPSVEAALGGPLRAVDRLQASAAASIPTTSTHSQSRCRGHQRNRSCTFWFRPSTVVTTGSMATESPTWMLRATPMG